MIRLSWRLLPSCGRRGAVGLSSTQVQLGNVTTHIDDSDKARSPCDWFSSVWALVQLNSAPLQCSFAVTCFDSVGRNELLLIKVATARLGLPRSGRPLIGYLFETGQDSGCPVEQMVLVKGENIHLRFVGSPSEERVIPLKKRGN